MAAGVTRTLSLYNIHTKETVTATFKRDGKFVPEALERLSWALRDWRRDEATKMDPDLFDLLWEIHDELGSKEPIHIISGYRSRGTNDMLRRTVGGQASQSRHILGKAADVHFPDVPLRLLRYSALLRERGGVGYYPTSAIPFVHVDTDRVRAWPRLPRYELALLFPSGKTHHMPADGGQLTRDDARAARGQHPDLSRQVASFLDARRTHRPVMVAMADAPKAAPDTVRATAAPPPRPAPAPALIAASASGPTAADRARLDDLARLASAEPHLVRGPMPASRRSASAPPLTGEPVAAGLVSPPAAAPVGPRVAAIDPNVSGAPEDVLTDGERRDWGSASWTPAPAYDDEHPDELSYRPFPILPLLTATADDPILTTLVHPDASRAIDLIDQPGSTLPLRFRPGLQIAELMEAHYFSGEAVGLARLYAAQAPPPVAAGRLVRTSER
jgi:uncharacterized protein YcbK (DUF882 family)